MVELFGIRINSAQLMMCLVALVLMGALVLMIGYTKIGLAIRATEQNTKAASLMGIDVNFVISFTFFLAGASAAIAGGLIASHYRIVFPMMGFMVGMKAFSAAVLGGIGSLPGSIIGGLVIGVSESMAVAFLGSAYQDSVAFVILIMVLIVRPTGLFGKKAIIKV
jgi:branched-chain amino acid transport system permease protein